MGKSYSVKVDKVDDGYEVSIFCKALVSFVGSSMPPSVLGDVIRDAYREVVKLNNEVAAGDRASDRKGKQC